MIARGRWVGLTLVVASVAALGVSTYSSYRSREYAKCQSAVSEALIQATNARAAAGEQDRQSDRDESIATAELIQGVFSATTREQSRAVYENYRKRMEEITARREATEKERQAHPLPAPPSQTCR